MSKINPITIDTAQGSLKETLSAVKAKLGGMLPNLFGVVAHSPASLNAYLAQIDTLNKGRLSSKAREQVAIAIASKNGCEYCLAAHTQFGKISGLDANALSLAQAGKASDPKTQALLDLALEINKSHGRAGAAIYDKARAAGLSDEEVIEVAAHVALSIFTNSVNGLAGTEVDFPKVTLSNAA